MPVLRRRALPAAGGFALLGLIVVLTMLAFGLGAMVVFADRVLEGSRADAVTKELQEIYRAVVGDQRDTFGFVGEVGTYPTTLYDLVANPGNAGWRGPYLRDPRVANSMLLDPWGQPYEYYLVSGVSGSDQLALISRGPDGLSTNTAANPNISTGFTGVVPTAADYFSSDARNADNIVFPRPDPAHADTFNINTDSIVNVALNNYDENDLVNAFVPACPGLFNITMTNVARGTDDVASTPYSPGFQVTLPQGTYRVRITTPLFPTAPVDDRIVVFPVVPVYRTYNVTGLDSVGTDPYTLTLTNKYVASTITAYSFAATLGNVSPNATVTFTPKACSSITIKIGATTVDTFTMPFGNFAKIIGATSAGITITNNLSVKVQVYSDGQFIGEVKNAKTGTFNSGLVAGNVITIKRVDTGATVKTVTLVAGSQSTSVP